MKGVLFTYHHGGDMICFSCCFRHFDGHIIDVSFHCAASSIRYLLGLLFVS